jgi:hypothetical protein
MTNRLADRQDMCLIEGVVEGGSTMTRRAERNALRRDCRVRFAGEIRCHQSRHVDQHRWLDCFACERAYLASHLFLPSKASLIIRAALKAFYYYVERIWLRTLRRRSQKDRFSWQRMHRLAADWIPKPRILHPYPDKRFAVTHPRLEPCAGIPPAQI